MLSSQNSRLHVSSSLRSQLNDRGVFINYGDDGISEQYLQSLSLMRRKYISNSMLNDYYRRKSKDIAKQNTSYNIVRSKLTPRSPDKSAMTMQNSKFLK